MQAPWTPVSILAWTRSYLADKGVENARLEAEWMLCRVLGLDRVGLYLNHDRPLVEPELAAYRCMIARRSKREPLQHILGGQEFCGLDFKVTPDVLIPRHDTETLVEEAIARMPRARRILDIGTGSGCIAVILARRIPGALVTALDVSGPALAVARSNAAEHAVEIEFLCGSLFDPVRERTFDLIVSNPPYIPSREIETLEPEVRDYDPRVALDGGKDGLDIYREMIPAAIRHLEPGGWLLVEIGQGQGSGVESIFAAAGGYGAVITARDPGGTTRVVGARKEADP